MQTALALYAKAVMAKQPQLMMASHGSIPPLKPSLSVKSIGLIAAVLVMLALIVMPALPNLPAAGQMMLAILAFAVIVWMTQALDYAVSAVVIGALMVFLLAYVPDAAKPAASNMGTQAALALALSGFANSAVALVAAACFIAAGMTATGLDRRIALVVLSKVSARTHTSHRARCDGCGFSAVVCCTQHHSASGLPCADHDGFHFGLQGG